MPGCCGVQRLAEPQQLGVASDQPSGRGGSVSVIGKPRNVARCSSCRALRVRRSAGFHQGGLALQDVPVKLFRFGLRLDFELPLEDAHARLVLAERSGATIPGCVETHQRAVRGFFERIERDQPQGRLDCAIGFAALAQQFSI